MKVLDKRLWRMIKNSRGQYLAILGVLVVGLLIYTALNIASLSLSDTVDTYYIESNFADFNVQVVKILPAAVENLIDGSTILNAQGRHVLEAPVITDDEDERVIVRLISLPDQQEIINDLTLIKGQLLTSGSDEVLLIEKFAQARGLNPGDYLTFQAGGRQHKLKVSGIVASPEFVYLMENEQNLLPNPEQYGVVYVSENFAATRLGLQYDYNEILISTSPQANIELLEEQLKEDLDKYGIKRIITQENQSSNRMVSEEVSGLEKSSSSVPLVFLGVAAAILAVMIGRMVKNDRMTIGVLKAIGYTNFQIISHYIKYALSLGILGSVIGVSVGMSISGAMSKAYVQFFNIPMLQLTIYYRFIFFAILLSAVFCIGSGLLGARNVLKISPAESMRPEAPQTGNRILLERLPQIWQRISFSWKIVLRNTFRSKKRFLFIAFGIALSYSVLLFAVYMGDVFDAMFDKHYGEFQKMDYSINFSRPLPMRALHELAELTDAVDLEPKSEFPFEFTNGRVSRVVNIIGLLPDTVFYSFNNPSGAKLSLPEDGILISLNLARVLNVEAGDTVTVSSFIPDRDDVELKVKGVVNQLLGINGYMNLESMNQLLLDEGLMTGVYINGGENLNARLRQVPNISSIMSIQEIIAAFYEFIGLMIIGIGFMVIMGGILGFAIVYSATSMSIGERTLEFSSLRVMGFSKKEIFNIVVKENVLMAVVGILAGIPLGNMFLKSLDMIFSNELYTLNVPAGWLSYVLTAIVTAVFIIIAQWATRRKIDRLEFLEALKNRVV